jgi:hypothetical protein
LLLCITTSFSCRKNANGCKANCVELSISGRALDKTTNQGFAYIPVSVHWASSFTMGGISGSPKLVHKASTDDQGRFSFSVTVDSSLFERNHLEVSVPLQEGYLDDFNDHLEKNMFEYSPVDLQGIEFGMYPTADLTIRLHRDQSDPFEYFSVQHYYSYDRPHYNDYLLAGNDLPGDTVIRTKTSADIYTLIISTKTSGFGSFSEKIDSIICDRNNENVIDITY